LGPSPRRTAGARPGRAARRAHGVSGRPASVRGGPPPGPPHACLRREGAAVPDVYATIAELDTATQERLAGILELRAADRQQRAMLESVLSEVRFPSAARALEIGCGTGPVTRALAGRPGVAEVVGIDPSPVFLAQARALAGEATNLSYEQGDGRSL